LLSEINKSHKTSIGCFLSFVDTGRGDLQGHENKGQTTLKVERKRKRVRGNRDKRE
jgi:hypothetical protein